MIKIIKILLLIGIVFYLLYALGYVDFDFAKVKKQITKNPIYTTIKDKAIDIAGKLRFHYDEDKEKIPVEKEGEAKKTETKGGSKSGSDEITEKDRQELDELLEKY